MWDCLEFSSKLCLMKIRVGINILIVLFFASCGQGEIDKPDKEKQDPEPVVCDTILPLTIELLKNDVYMTEFEGIEMPQTLRFTMSIYNSETKESSELQIPFSNSTFNKLSGNTKYNGVDLDTIFVNTELQSYTSIPVLNECINWKIITTDTMKYWNDQYQDEVKKDINFNMPREWFRYYGISTPVISNSGEYIYVEIDKYCWGLCSQGFSYLFRKVNGTWTCFGRWTRWVA